MGPSINRSLDATPRLSVAHRPRDSAVGDDACPSFEIVTSDGQTMVVTTIYVTRHAFRVSYTLNTTTGEYHTNSPSPTNIPSDPPLAAYGVQQSHELAIELAKLDPPVDYLYSSPFYRCLQTLEPAVEKLRPGIRVRAENGIGEWYGVASFDHPSPATPAFLKSLFLSSFDNTYQASLIPPRAGETVSQLHDRVAVALAHIIASTDAESTTRDTSILICTHAATLIAIGRTLTGNMPDDPNVDDFLAPTAGITKFVRKQDPKVDVSKPSGHETAKSIGSVDWRDGKGVAGGWTCVLNGNCDHLTGGAERSWHFSGEETFGDLKPGQKIVSAEAGNVVALSGQVHRMARKSRI